MCPYFRENEKLFFQTAQTEGTQFYRVWSLKKVQMSSEELNKFCSHLQHLDSLGQVQVLSWQISKEYEQSLEGWSTPSYNEGLGALGVFSLEKRSFRVT